MDCRGQSKPYCPQKTRAPFSRATKKNLTPLVSAIEDLCATAGKKAGQVHASRITEHVMAHLANLGSHTITGLITTCGNQFKDWSADYRLYTHNRLIPEYLFEPVRQWLCENQTGPIVISMDDTRIKKTGRKVYGTSYARDPMGPAFHVNLIRAQRFVQMSMACKGEHGQARAIPVDWFHAPVVPKLKPSATDQEKQQYKEDQKKRCLSAVGAQRICLMRTWLDENGHEQQPLWIVVDGSYTNGTVLKNLPSKTTLVGRIRSDTKLYYPAQDQPDLGRRRVYGEKAPTPEELRCDQSIPWQGVEVFYGGARRCLRVKYVKNLLWRTAGQHYRLQMVVIAPTSYKLSANSKTLYRKQAYLICTDPEASINDIVQHYIWRWDIEVNNRDEKTLLGVGDAQVRTKAAVQNVTGCAVAAYAMLLVASAQCRKNNLPHDHLPAPIWGRKRSNKATTMKLIQNLRYELWGKSIHFSGFAVKSKLNTSLQKCKLPLESAVFYASAYS